MTPLLVLSEADVVELLDMEGCIGAMEQALAALDRGEVTFPLRPLVRAPGENHLLGMMPAYRGGERPLYSLKTVAVMPDNPARGLDALEASAAERGVSMAGLALAWLLSHPGVTSIVVGPRNPAHLEPVREALALAISPAEHEEVGSLFT